MTIKEAQELLETIIEKKNIQDSSQTNIANLTISVGSLASTLARHAGGTLEINVTHNEIDRELGEILWALLILANQNGIDLTEALSKALERKV